MHWNLMRPLKCPPPRSNNRHDNLKPQSLQTKSRRRRLVRVFFTIVAAAFVLFIVLLHVLAAMFSLHDRNMAPYASHVFTNSFNQTIRYYELKQTNTEWN